MAERPKVVVVGGGFGGLNAARTLAAAPVDVTLVDRQNHHLFQPLLYQVATAALAAPDIAMPLRRIFRRQENCTVLLGEVTGVDVEGRRVLLGEEALPYDYLVLATGATHAYFGRDEWAAHAPGLKSLKDAFEIRRRILCAFEAAERAPDAATRAPWLTFAVIGGGPTGVELAGALAEISRHTLARDFRNFDPGAARVLLLEGGPRILAGFPEELSAKARAQLEDLGVEVRTDSRVTEIDAGGIALGEERIPTRTVLWAAGVAGSPVAATTGAPLDRAGRVEVAADLSLPGHPEVFVVGDLAHVPHGDGMVPGVAPAAIQGGVHAGRQVLRLLAGEATEPFAYVDKGSMATIGRSRGIAAIGRLHLAGLSGWLAWLAVHLVFLIGFRNRLVVLFEWAWCYLTYQRSARVIVPDAGGFHDEVDAEREVTPG